MLLQEILKRYKPHEILDILTMEEIDYRVAVVLHKDRKKVFIANDVKVIKNLNPDLEVLICNSATEFDKFCSIPENLKVIYCPLVKELPYTYRLPETLEYIVLNSLLDDEDGFFYEKHFDHFRYTRVKKLYMDSITKIDLTRFPNVEYLSINSVVDFKDLNCFILPKSLKFLSIGSMREFNVINNKIPHIAVGSITDLVPSLHLYACYDRDVDGNEVYVRICPHKENLNGFSVNINDVITSNIYKY